MHGLDPFPEPPIFHLHRPLKCHRHANLALQPVVLDAFVLVLHFYLQTPAAARQFVDVFGIADMLRIEGLDERDNDEYRPQVVADEVSYLCHDGFVYLRCEKRS